MHDPAAWLIRAIESGDYSQPQKVEKKRVQKMVEQRQKAKDDLRERFAGEYMTYLSGELEALRTEHEQAYEIFCGEFTQYWDLTCRDLSDDKQEIIRLQFFENFTEENPVLEIFTFWQWVEHKRLEKLD